MWHNKQYEQQKKCLLKAALHDSKAAAKVYGGDGTSSVPKKLSWTLVNSKVGKDHDWETGFACLGFEIISGEWKSDRASPTSQVGGQETRRRYCEVDGTVYYARLVKNPAGDFALFQGKIKSASEWEAPGPSLPLVKEEAKEAKEVRPPAHHCRSLLTQAHCSLPTDACSASCSSQHAQLTVHAVLSCAPFFLSLLPPTACRMLSSHVHPSFSHCYPPLPAGEEEEDKQGGRRKQERRQGGTQGIPKEEVKKQAPQSKAEGKKAPEAKKVEARAAHGYGCIRPRMCDTAKRASTTHTGVYVIQVYPKYPVSEVSQGVKYPKQ